MMKTSPGVIEKDTLDRGNLTKKDWLKSKKVLCNTLI